MTIHYHGTPITPYSALYALAGRHFCVSHFRPDQVDKVHALGQSVLLDNGAFSKWKKDKPTDWPGYYAWTDRWLDFPTTWAIIPDVIGAGSQEQDSLIAEWPHGHRGAPVFHLDAHGMMPISRLLRLTDEWPKVCIGWAEKDIPILSDPYVRAMDTAWNELAKRHRRPPWIHMLRGMQLSRQPWPFASLDSTDIAQNHHREHNTPASMADRWDAANCPGSWTHREDAQEPMF